MKKSEYTLAELKKIKVLLITLKKYIICYNLKALGVPLTVTRDIIRTNDIERFLFFCKELEEPGLCVYIALTFSGIIKRRLLWLYLHDHTPPNGKRRFQLSGSNYWWKPHSAKPRIVWLEKQINLLNNQINEDTTKKC